MTKVTDLHSIRATAIKDLMDNLRVVQVSAESARERLADILEGKPMLKENRVLLAVDLLMTIPDAIEPMRAVGVLLNEDIENDAVDDMERDLSRLLELAQAEGQRAAETGEPPRSISYAGYQIVSSAQ